MLTIARRARKGFRLLDQKLGKSWALKIDVPKLNIFYLNECMLGQLYGSYHQGRTALGLSDSQAEEHAFAARPGHLGTFDWMKLTSAWKKAVASRLKELAPPNADAAIVSLKHSLSKKPQPVAAA